MHLPFKRLAISAIVLFQGAGSPSVLAGTEHAASSRDFQQMVGDVASNTEYSSGPACEMNDPHQLSIRGSNSTLELRNLPYTARIDARGATFEAKTRRRHHTIVTLYGGTNLCWIGGHISSYSVRRYTELTARHKPSAIIMRDFEPQANIAIHGLIIDGDSNGVAIVGDINSITWDEGYVQSTATSCISLGVFGSLTVRRSLFDGCRDFLGANTLDNRGEIIIEHNLIHVYSKNGLGRGNSVFGGHHLSSISMNNNIFLFDTYDSFALNYDQLLRSITDCKSNIFIVPEVELGEVFDSECGLVTFDSKIWQEAKAAWLHLYSDDPSNFHVREVGESGMLSRDDVDRIETVRSSHWVEASDSNNLMAEMRTNVLEARDLVSDSRRSVQEATAAAQRARQAFDRFLGRWSDESLWFDGTGWVE